MSVGAERHEIERALEVLGAPVQVEVLGERQELLRFGAGRITYQHSESRLRLRARLVRDGRAAWGTVETLDPGALRELRERLESLLSSLPATGEALSQPGPPPRSATTSHEATVAAGAEDRVALLERIAAALPAGADLGGSITNSVAQHVIASTEGLYRDETRTRAAVQVVASVDGCSSYARRLHRDAAGIDGDELAAALGRGLEALPPRALERGTYRAVLAPAAVANLVAIFGQIAAGGAAVQRGQSALSGQEGEQVVSPLVTLVDDGCDVDGLPSSFDCEGSAKRRVVILDQGVFREAVHDSRTGARSGAGSTGHAVPPGWRFGAGPSPSHLLLSPGDATDEALLAACGEGLFIQRVDYVRTQHPRDTVVTGTTRDATLWLSGGRPVARLPQFRFTLKLTDLLSAVEALGQRRERHDAVFMESVAAPAALVSAFPVGDVVS